MWPWGAATHGGVHLADGILEHLHILHVKAFLEFLQVQKGWGSGPRSPGVLPAAAPTPNLGTGEPHLRERLIDFNGVQAAGA